MKRFAGPSRMTINTYEIKTVNLTSISESAKLSEALRNDFSLPSPRPPLRAQRQFENGGQFQLGPF